MFQFSTGALWAKPFGVFTAPNPTPMQFGTLQDASFDISGTMKELYGRNMIPDDVKRAQIKITGKAKFARIFGKIFNDLFWGQTPPVGNLRITTIDEAHSVPGSTAYTVTIAPPSTGTFLEDLGVIYSSTGVRFVKVASAPAAGQYSVDESTGIYTFASGDANAAVLISYSYTASAAGGSRQTFKNQQMGMEPSFVLELGNLNPATGSTMRVKFYAAKCSKLTMAVKNEDFVIPEFDFTCFADAGGNVMDFDTSE